MTSSLDAPSGLHPYLREALDVVQQHALTAGSLDWDALRLDVGSRSRGAVSAADCYPVIEWVLTQLDDGHSFFAPPDRGSAAIAAGTYSAEVAVPSGRLTSAGVAEVVVPGFRGAPSAVRAYADTLRVLVDDLHAAGARGWVIDVTGNGGGNMIPMIAGLAPLLGTGAVGGFRSADDVVSWWTLDSAGGLSVGAEAMAAGRNRAMDPALATARVAVVTGAGTASSGEAVVLSLRGRHHARSFGKATQGLATCNDAFDLPDGATLMVTTAWMVDRRGVSYPGPVVPDVLVSTSHERALVEAARWAADTDR